MKKLLLRPRNIRRHGFPIILRRLGALAQILGGHHSLVARVRIEKEIVKNAGQPRFQIAPWSKLTVSAECARAGFLDAVLRFVIVAHQMKRHPVEMIQINHDLRRESFPSLLARIASAHGRAIVIEGVGGVQLRAFP